MTVNMGKKHDFLFHVVFYNLLATHRIILAILRDSRLMLINGSPAELKETLYRNMFDRKNNTH